ncbi:hypothetical protein HY993_01820 [Candidatus Micrarchaeota archaeon]|nr:hypothetical protein [Candidatus Micrarchaeota archaeon]
MVLKRRLVIPADHSLGAELRPVRWIGNNVEKKHVVLVASGFNQAINARIYFILGTHVKSEQKRDGKNRPVENRHEYHSLDGLEKEEREKIFSLAKNALKPKEEKKKGGDEDARKVFVQGEKDFLNVLKNPNSPLAGARIEEIIEEKK